MVLLMETIAKGLIILNDRYSGEQEDTRLHSLYPKTTASLPSNMMISSDRQEMTFSPRPVGHVRGIVFTEYGAGTRSNQEIRTPV